MEQNIAALSHENVLIALLVVLVLLWVGSMLMDFIIKVRTLRKPQEKEAHDMAEHQRACDKKFANDQKRLDDLEKRMGDVEEGQRVICKGLYVVIEHMLHNGNEADMREASTKLFDFLNS